MISCGKKKKTKTAETCLPKKLSSIDWKVLLKRHVNIGVELSYRPVSG